MEQNTQGGKKVRNPFHNALMNAYIDTHLDEIEKGTCNGLVTPGMLSQLFKLYMISPY
jgi:hypothetical protein